MKTLMFVYGTLKAGNGNNARFLKAARLVGVGVTIDRFRMINVGFPVIFRDMRDGHPVVGEVYEVDADTRRRIDGLEGEGHMYHRQRAMIKLASSGAIVDCEVYVGDLERWRWERDVRDDDVPVNADGWLEWRRGEYVYDE